jgi:signal transduction histidine kinase
VDTVNGLDALQRAAEDFLAYRADDRLRPSSLDRIELIAAVCTLLAEIKNTRSLHKKRTSGGKA